MTATPDAPAAPLYTVRSLNATRMLLRMVQRVIGAAFLLAVVGLWIVPGSSLNKDLMLMKLLLSLVAGLGGITLLLSSGTPTHPDAEIDVVAREVRLVRLEGRERKLVQRCGFDSLSRVEREGTGLRLWDQHGEFMAEVSLCDGAATLHLIAGLRQAGKL